MKTSQFNILLKNLENPKENITSQELYIYAIRAVLLAIIHNQDDSMRNKFSKLLNSIEFDEYYSTKLERSIHNHFRFALRCYLRVQDKDIKGHFDKGEKLFQQIANKFD